MTAIDWVGLWAAMQVIGTIAVAVVLLVGFLGIIAFALFDAWRS